MNDERILAKRVIRTLAVKDKKFITPNMLRITLAGEFPANQEGAHIKLIFSNQDNPRILRTYTIARQRHNEIDIDFVVHGTNGIACNWALNANLGDIIDVGGPGSRKLVNFDANYFVFAADMTALPALSVNLAMISDNASGCAVIEVINEQDIQQLQHPKEVNIIWLINSEPGANPNLLADNLRNNLENIPDNSYIWAACEFSSMRNSRSLIRDEWQIERGSYYLSSYWKLGAKEEEHRTIKSQDDLAN